ncbi:hypothetical protein SELMODRAFT_404818 [Selaginella moellendorffii]|uniref:Uncharacterized protein n=1 Tax=Selaginella moellendorffii TaxID=88036 RepID=D8QXG5_SELML|nr:hypothetical protein SELMODRAFT_404818 [Selaginella moellendorffii]
MANVTVAYCITITRRIPKGASVEALIPLARARIQAEIHGEAGDFSFYPTPYANVSASEWCKIGGMENVEDAKLWGKLPLLEKMRQYRSSWKMILLREERIKFGAGFCELSTQTYINKWIKEAWSLIRTPPEAKRFLMDRIGIASEDEWTFSCVCVPKTDRGNHWKNGGLIIFLPDERTRDLTEGTLLKEARLYRLHLAEKVKESTGKTQEELSTGKVRKKLKKSIGKDQEESGKAQEISDDLGTASETFMAVVAPEVYSEAPTIKRPQPVTENEENLLVSEMATIVLDKQTSEYWKQMKEIVLACPERSEAKVVQSQEAAPHEEAPQEEAPDVIAQLSQRIKDTEEKLNRLASENQRLKYLLSDELLIRVLHEFTSKPSTLGNCGTSRSRASGKFRATNTFWKLGGCRRNVLALTRYGPNTDQESGNFAAHSASALKLAVVVQKRSVPYKQLFSFVFDASPEDVIRNEDPALLLV